MIVSPEVPENAQRYPAWAAGWAEADYVAIHGSEAYGLATATSDLDVKGAYIPRRSSLLRYRDLPAEQLEFSPQESTPGRLLGPHDAAIYSLQKLCRLGAACNPNVVEMLFVHERHIVKMTPLGERIRELGPRFLSLRARQTFGEYARGQLRRMDQHRRWLMQPPKGSPPKRVGEPSSCPSSRLDRTRSTISGRMSSGRPRRWPTCGPSEAWYSQT